MTRRSKRLLLWFIRMGRNKACIVHFLLLSALYIVFIAVLNLILSAVTHSSFIEQCKNNLPFCCFFFVCAPFISWRFYDVALLQLKDYKKLEKKGLTLNDLQRIAFVKKWDIIRKVGIARYCFFSGGLIMGMLLLFPLSLLILSTMNNTDKLFKDITAMMAFTGRNILISYLIGLIVYCLRWLHNERRFKRLTNPL